MYLRKFLIAGIALMLLALGCSDNGNDTPVDPQINTNPTISIADVSVTEGASADFVFTLSKVLSVPVDIYFHTVDGTATAGEDYIGQTSGGESIAAGLTSAIQSVSTVDDAVIDSTETFMLVIDSATVAVVDSIGVCTITNNDVAAGVSYLNDIKPILSSSGCNAAGICHGSGAGGFTFGNLSRGSVIAASGNHGAIVSPGNASASNLYLKTTGSPPFLSRMPIGGPFLTTAQQNLIRDWIDQGALDN